MSIAHFQPHSNLPLCPVRCCCALLLLSLPFAVVAAASVAVTFIAALSISVAVSVFHCCSIRFGLLLLSLLSVPVRVKFWCFFPFHHCCSCFQHADLKFSCHMNVFFPISFLTHSCPSSKEERLSWWRSSGKRCHQKLWFSTFCNRG